MFFDLILGKYCEWSGVFEFDYSSNLIILQIDDIFFLSSRSKWIAAAVVLAWERVG